MCYYLFLSTSSEEDFTELPKDHYNFERDFKEEEAVFMDGLEYRNRWYISGRYGGCSCHFRFFMGDVEFGPEEDWREEDPEAVESTAELFDVFKRLVSEGHRLDAIAVWAGTEPDMVGFKEVLMAELKREDFLFLENYRFVLRL